MKRRFVETSVGSVHLREAGSGSPLLLIHRTAESGEQFDDVLPALAEQHRVIAPDTPGFGDSDAPASPPGIAGYARNLIEVLDRLGIERASLLGHRTGASFVAEVAATYPERVEKLILSGCPDYTPDQRQRKGFPIFDQTPSDDGSHLTDRWHKIVANVGEGLTAEQIQRSVLMILKADTHSYWAYEAVYEQDIHERIERIAAPSLLLYGEQDPFVRWVPELTPHFRDVQVRNIPGAHALTMFHVPAEFARIVLEFLG